MVGWVMRRKRWKRPLVPVIRRLSDGANARLRLAAVKMDPRLIEKPSETRLMHPLVFSAASERQRGDRWNRNRLFGVSRRVCGGWIVDQLGGRLALERFGIELKKQFTEVHEPMPERIRQALEKLEKMQRPRQARRQAG